MMKTNPNHAQSGALTAIAAALALSSTPVWAQEVPASTTDAQPTSSAPATPVESVPESTAPAQVEVISSEPVAAAATEPKRTTTAAKATKARSTARASTPARPVRAATPAAAAAPVAAAPAAPAPATPVRQPVATAPTPAPAPTTAETPAGTMPGVDEDALMLGGGALALLALGGAAVAMRRRRRHEGELMAEDHVVEEDVVNEPVAEPVSVAVTPRHDPAESWTPAMAPAPIVRTPAPAMHAATDRHSGETWVERAHRGPTPDNPSLSLRKRLKRAAFFDARERQVAEGRAEPVATDAGLPDNVAAPAPTHEREREREHAFA